MKERQWLWVLLIPLVVIGGWALIMGWLHHSGRRSPIIHKDALVRTELTWSNFDFAPLVDGSRIARLIDSQVQSLRGLDDEQIKATRSVIADVLTAYGRPDWDAFLRFRLPLPDYSVGEEWGAALLEYCPDRLSAAGNRFEQYRQIWAQTFQKPLWTEVAFFESSLTVTNIERLEGFSFGFPEIGPKTNQNFLGHSIGAAFEYPDRLKRIADTKRITLLRFCFMGGLRDENIVERRPFMFIFYWDPDNGRWIPRSFEHEYIRSPTHVIRFF